MRDKQELDTTTNRKVYKRVYKRLSGKCTYCPWHGGENATRRKRTSKPKRSR